MQEKSAKTFMLLAAFITIVIVIGSYLKAGISSLERVTDYSKEFQN
jgi:hypothetical protein